MAFQNAFIPSGDDQFGDLRREKSLQTPDALDFHHLIGDTLLEGQIPHGEIGRLRTHLIMKTFAFDGCGDARAQQGRIERLRQIIVGTEFDAANDALDLVDGRNHNDRDVPQLQIVL